MMRERLPVVLAIISLGVAIYSLLRGIIGTDLVSALPSTSTSFYIFLAAAYTLVATSVAVFARQISSFMRTLARTKRVVLFHAPGEASDYARTLRDELKKRGVSTWIDFDEILPGDDVFRVIEHETANADAAVFILCDNSPNYFDRFYGFAIDSKTKLIPVRWNGAKLPEKLSNLHSINSAGNAESDADAVVKALGRKPLPEK